MEEFESEIDEVESENEEDGNHESDDPDYTEEKPIPLYKVPFKGKWKKYYDSRHLKKEWIEMYPWVDEHPEDPRSAVCRVCNIKVRAHKGVLEAHQKTRKHLTKLSGYDDLEEDGEPKAKKMKTENEDIIQPSEVLLNDIHPQFMHPFVPPKIESLNNLEPVVIDNQIAYFSESPQDAAHNGVTEIIDKLVETYHETRVENLHVQNAVKMQLLAQQAALAEARRQRIYEQKLQANMYKQTEHEFQLQLLQHRQQTALTAIEEEQHLKLKSMQQKVLFKRQEYEKKMKLFDEQLQLMK